MSRFQILADELNTDPLGRNYVSMTDAQAAQDINTAYRQVNYPVDVSVLEYAVRESLKWAEFRERGEAKDAAEDIYLNPNMAEFMDIFFTTSSTQGAQIDMQGDYMGGLLDRCVAEGSMGPLVAQQLKNFGVQTVSRGTELQIGIVTEGDVAYARTL